MAAEQMAKQVYSKTAEIRISVIFDFCALQVDSVAIAIVVQRIPGQQ